MFLIDGHNLIGAGALPIALSDPDDESKLIGWLQGYHMLYPNESLIVVFDAGRESGGAASSQTRDGVTVRYAPRGTTADTVIVKTLEKLKNARSITVVSSDNAVRKAAMMHGAKLLSSPEFAARLNERPRKKSVQIARARKPEKPEAETNTDYWLNEFAKHKPPPLPAAPKHSAPLIRKSNSPPPAQKAQPAFDADGKPLSSDTDYWLNAFSKQAPPPLPPPPSKAATPRPSHKKSPEVEDIEYWLREFTRPRKNDS